MTYENIGKRIREKRIAKGITQESLAEQLDIDASFLSRIENGHNKASLESYIKICEILDTTLDYLTQDEIPMAYKSIAEQEFSQCLLKLNDKEIEFLMSYIRKFTEYCKEDK